MYRILSINPGSTSTKFAIYEDDNQLLVSNIQHSADELKIYEQLFDQLDFRKNMILNELFNHTIDIRAIDIVIGRGGLLRPLTSGIYLINDKMISELKASKYGTHASNLGASLSFEISKMANDNCKAYIVDPVVVDEMQDIARISGLPQFPRRSNFHALNHKAVARKYANDIGSTYENLNLVIAHLGGGISVAAHCKGKVIDLNQGLDGYGPFSPERAGTLDAGALVKLCFAGKHTHDEIKKMLAGQGGLIAHLGTNDVREVEKRMIQGDAHATLILQAMAYTIAKEIGAMFAVMKGKVDAIILTGGIAYSDFVVNYIQDMTHSLATVKVYPGEDEMRSLSEAGWNVLKGAKVLNY